MVIDIILDNGKKLLLDAETQIEWVRENMFFEKDVQLRGKYSYPFTINREANSEPLNFPDIIEAAVSDIKLGCRVLIYGTEFYKGQINVLDWDDGIINISITRDTTAFDTDQYIDELDLGTFMNIADFGNRNADRAKVYPEVDYAFPQFYAVNKETLKKIGSSNDSNYIIINWQNGNSEDATGEEVAIPMFYLLSVIENVFANYKIALKSPLINDDDFKKKVVFNPVQPNLLNYDFNAEVFNSADWNFLHYGAISCHQDLLVQVGLIFTMRVVEWNFGAIVGQTNVTYSVSSGDFAGGTAGILQGMRDEILATVSNTAVISENYSGTISASNPYGFAIEFTTGNRMAIVYQEDNITSVSQLTLGANGGVENDLFTRQFIPFRPVGYAYHSEVLMKKHLPHITVSEFLNALKNNFNLAIELDEAKDIFYIDYRKSLMNTINMKDFTSRLIEGNEGFLETPENITITLDHDDSNDELTKTLQKTADNYPQASLEPITEIRTNAGTCFVELLRNSNSGVKNQPKVDSLLGTYTEPVDFGLRFLHCHGYVADSAGLKSVFADSTGLTANEVYTDYYKDWYEFVYSLVKAPTYYFDFGMIELKQQLPTIWRVKYTEFVWKRMTTIIHNTKGILPTKVEGYRKA